MQAVISHGPWRKEKFCSLLGLDRCPEQKHDMSDFVGNLNGSFAGDQSSTRLVCVVLLSILSCMTFSQWRSLWIISAFWFGSSWIWENFLIIACLFGSLINVLSHVIYVAGWSLWKPAPLGCMNVNAIKYTEFSDHRSFVAPSDGTRHKNLLLAYGR